MELYHYSNSLETDRLTPYEFGFRPSNSQAANWTQPIIWLTTSKEHRDRIRRIPIFRYLVLVAESDGCLVRDSQDLETSEAWYRMIRPVDIVEVAKYDEALDVYVLMRDTSATMREAVLLQDAPHEIISREKHKIVKQNTEMTTRRLGTALGIGISFVWEVLIAIGSPKCLACGGRGTEMERDRNRTGFKCTNCGRFWTSRN